ncbi:MAG: bifunctional D-glycero-beta-D-manno-heptose-7-phosphate kinase/D-glycero-beta-D-manno-heptose 1-phosphate adenylyltransferase HldE [Methylococcales bacterium]|nr:bifunctional D-glycero-beta-D-manno-heptose-7-phosphate kinase/D-glycero-beta-D-manno-heptose 1-phosphate adenylyltransferase HldE [Methylococcales bacterium]MBT7409430.1 bifunctional D-glycero-beta-D-manno-heptose-7-phosphate kinase/D-glycero-beta-D-manno-heptose 1-phosphate adenylyltransferase HldE [Methylococcales bacterium]
MKIPTFENASVLVVGDVMLDRYWYGATSRVSPEAPVPVVSIGKSEERAGGAANVALNISTLGAKSSLLCITGNDAESVALEGLMDKAGVQCHFQKLDGAPTITKLRVMSRHQQLIRLDFEDGFNEVDEALIYQVYEEQIQNHDVIILSDYGKGTIKSIETLIASAKAVGKKTLIDPKGTDFSKYRGATLITPNLLEFETVVGKCHSVQEIEEKGQALIHEIELDALLVTRGECGMTLLQKDQPPHHMPTHAKEVFDVTGAGDTVISVLGAGLSAGLPLPNAVALSNLAAGIVVAKVGTATVSMSELRRACHELKQSDKGVLDEDALVLMVQDARAQSESIVMTNGCFDILHVGHIAYLEEARQLGDRLIIAVNDDASVKELKGNNRPINALPERMKMLSALDCVDWVVPFSEDTPEKLICNILPDVLVKGGDYEAHEVAGHDCVVENGGEVKILKFLDGHSTSKTIENIRQKEK